MLPSQIPHNFYTVRTTIRHLQLVDVLIVLVFSFRKRNRFATVHVRLDVGTHTTAHGTLGMSRVEDTAPLPLLRGIGGQRLLLCLGRGSRRCVSVRTRCVVHRELVGIRRRELRGSDRWWRGSRALLLRRRRSRVGRRVLWWSSRTRSRGLAVPDSGLKRREGRQADRWKPLLRLWLGIRHLRRMRLRSILLLRLAVVSILHLAVVLRMSRWGRRPIMTGCVERSIGFPLRAVPIHRFSPVAILALRSHGTLARTGVR